MYGKEATIAINFAGHELDNVQGIQPFFQFEQGLPDFRRQAFILFSPRQFMQGLKVFGLGHKGLPRLKTTFQGLELAHDFFGFG